MLYTSKDCIFHVEIKFKQKIWFIIDKFEKKINFSIFGSKTRVTRYVRRLISQISYNKSQKWLCQELSKGLKLKVTKYELLTSNHLEMAGDYVQGGARGAPPNLIRVKAF